MAVKYFLMVMAVLAVSGAAIAEPVAPSPATTTSPAASPASSSDAFEAKKEHMLKSVGEHIAGMQKKQSCIQAAVSEDTLKGCFSSTRRLMRSQESKPAADNKPSTHP